MFSGIYFGLCCVALLTATLIVRHEYPSATVTVLFERIMADRVIRIAVVVIWWWLGWHFLAGQTVDPPV